MNREIFLDNTQRHIVGSDIFYLVREEHESVVKICTLFEGNYIYEELLRDNIEHLFGDGQCVFAWLTNGWLVRIRSEQPYVGYLHHFAHDASQVRSPIVSSGYFWFVIGGTLYQVDMRRYYTNKYILRPMDKQHSNRICEVRIHAGRGEVSTTGTVRVFLRDGTQYYIYQLTNTSTVEHNITKLMTVPENHLRLIDTHVDLFCVIGETIHIHQKVVVQDTNDREAGYILEVIINPKTTVVRVMSGFATAYMSSNSFNPNMAAPAAQLTPYSDYFVSINGELLKITTEEKNLQLAIVPFSSWRRTILVVGDKILVYTFGEIYPLVSLGESLESFDLPPFVKK